MFGLSLTKILVTVLAIVAAWRLFGLIARARRTTPAAPLRPKPPEAIEFRPCPRCGDYVAKGTECPRCRGKT